MNDKTMFLRPRLSEKAYALSEVFRTYVVEVPGDANKHSVARAMEAQFGINVVKVNIINAKGKPKRTVRKRARPAAGNRSDIKKAYVTLKEGEKLPFFAAVEEADKKAEKQAEKAAKTAAKEKK